jgi:multicomponent Na+:H+ antiporter subunit E
MNYFLLNIALALAWAAFSGRFDPENLLFGFVLGYVALLMARRALEPSPYFGKMRQALSFALFFFKELILANLQVAADVVTPTPHMQPRVLAIPLDAKTDVEITALANLISLTPGTLSLDVSTDRRVLFIHAMYATDADQTRRDIKQGLERRLLDLMRGEPLAGKRDR